MAEDSESRIDSQIYERLRRAREFMDDYYYLPLNLDQISRRACFSRYHFLRLFRRVFNQTPHQYLTRRRIDKAKELLASGKLTVTEVCFEVGFQSLGSFSALFHKYVGHPPVVYRMRASQRIGVADQSPQSFIPACFLIMFKIEDARQC